MRTLRVATYNIHKGVRGVGPLKRLEIYNLGRAVAALNADVVCLQEVRAFHRRLQQRFVRWPAVDQAQFLAPPGYHAVYQTHAITRLGEHGNAVLSRLPVLTRAHQDMSAHRFEQRGLLHVSLALSAAQDTTELSAQTLHVIVVHLGLIPSSRQRQVDALGRYIARAVPRHAPLIVAGDFNDWSERLHEPLAALGLYTKQHVRALTYPARWPLLPLDRIYARGVTLQSLSVPHGKGWSRWSDHLPLIAEVALP